MENLKYKNSSPEQIHFNHSYTFSSEFIHVFDFSSFCTATPHKMTRHANNQGWMADLFTLFHIKGDRRDHICIWDYA